MAHKWVKAAAKYRKKEKKKQRASNAEKEILIQVEREKDDKSFAILQSALDLNLFLNSSEGKAALELLGASKRHLIFGKEREEGYADVCYIDCTGLNSSYEANGVSWLYHKGEVPKPIFSKITALQAVQSAVWNGYVKHPSEVLPWLRRELDKIAEAAEEE